MDISNLQLINYRNYATENFSFSPGTNIIYGNNGQGKTNLLESIFVLVRGYSHRSSRFSELKKFGEKGMSLIASFKSKGASHRIKLISDGAKKKWVLDEKVQPGFSKIAPMTGAILFEPDDLEIVKASPDRRRRFINEELSGLSPSYRAAFRLYERVRAQRNALLKNLKFKKQDIATARALLEPWNTQLVDAAEAVFKERGRYLLKLNKEAKTLHQKLSGSSEVLSLEYQSNVFKELGELNDIRSVYLRALEENLGEDLDRGYTGPGPHADELLIKINGMPARQYASQGQQRTAAIALKLAHINLYEETLGERPVVLLDDILSELDQGRQERLLTVLSDAQSFITCTDPGFADKIESLSRERRQDIKRIHIDDGALLDAQA